MATPYDVIGNVVDTSGKPIKDVIVSDGTINVKTDNDGYYELKTEKRTLTYTAQGYNNNSFDLGKYKLGSKLNADVSLQNALQKNESEQITTKQGFYAKNKKTINYAIIGIVVIVVGYFGYKKFIKK